MILKPNDNRIIIVKIYPLFTIILMLLFFVLISIALYLIINKLMINYLSTIVSSLTMPLIFLSCVVF